MKKNRFYLHFIFFIFSVFLIGPALSGEDEKEQNERGLIVKKRRPKLSKIENIPLEILYEICSALEPIDIVHLSNASNKLKRKITDKFWESYLKTRHQEKWNSSVPAIKVAFAHSLFYKGRIERAALLGFPKAIKEINDREELKKHAIKKRSMKSIASENSLSYSVTYKSEVYFPFFIPLPFYMPLPFRK